jgi:hypothetical protein
MHFIQRRFFMAQAAPEAALQRGIAMKMILPTGLTRRTLLRTGGTLALLAAAKAALPGGAHAAGTGPETTRATLGFIALSDAGPLFVAKDKGLFAKYGMPDVEVSKQASWGTRATIWCSAPKATASMARIS